MRFAWIAILAPLALAACDTDDEAVIVNPSEDTATEPTVVVPDTDDEAVVVDPDDPDAAVVDPDDDSVVVDPD